MDKAKSSSMIMVVIVAAIIAGSLLGAYVYISGALEEEEVQFVEQQQLKFEEAEPTVSIPKADSDYIDNNENGVYDDGIDVLTPDGLSDIEEIYQYGTDVTNSDTDGDGMEDGWEAYFSRDPITSKWRVNPRTGRLAIDPNFKDHNEDPDNDGFDANADGRYSADENLTNLQEYCGGKIFEGHDPFDGENDDKDLRYIRSHGGFHMAWSLERDHPPSGFYSDWDPEYNREQFMTLYDKDWYLDYNPYKDPKVTTDPTDRDTDDDRMYDGWELYYQNQTKYFREIYGIPFTDNQTLDPMNPADGKVDMDVKKSEDTIKGIIPEIEYDLSPDGLSNIQEFENGTNPVLWDTDDDTFYDPGLQIIYEMDDRTELTQVEASCVSNTDWDRDGEYDLKTNPNDKDTDGDFMSDGFEIFYGLCPLNSSDRFLDLDNDGLLNYLEYRFPETGKKWFRTDPNNPDTDDDGIPDGWEAKNALVLTEWWWTFDAVGEEIKVVYEGERLHHIETQGVNYYSPISQALDGSDGIVDRHWYNFSVNPMVADEDNDLDGYWYDDPDIYYDETMAKYVEIDGDNDTIPDFHFVKDNLTNEYEYNGTANYTGDYYEGLTDPNNPDTDGDWLLDGDELLKSNRGQLIGDKWFTTTAAKEFYYTNPNLADSDQDFDPTNLSRSLDDWEEIHGMTKELVDGINNDGDQFTDEADEGINFGEKYDTFTGTNANSPDTDLDGMDDVDEVFGVETSPYDPDDITSGFGLIFTNPGNRDTDSDGAKDNDEIAQDKYYHPYMTDPNNPDTDGDLLKDGDELKVDYYPFWDYFPWDNYDANGDDDFDDKDLGDFYNEIDRTNPRLWDSDHDSLPDGWEAMHGGTIDLSIIGLWVSRHPTDQYAEILIRELDTNNDGKVGPGDSIPAVRIYLVNPLNPNDKFEDPDDDGLNNWEEYLNNTNPLRWDTDGDLLPDGWEIKFSKKNLDPTRPDTDADDISDDEDGDGNFDVVEEIINGIDDDGDGKIDEELDKNDANADPDHDGMFYYLYVKQPDNSWKYEQFYHPFTNYYEYYWGWSNDDDPFHEITTDPNEEDSDGDSLPDGWEIWISDYPIDPFNKSIYDDNDGLAKGWEDLFNGSMGLFETDFTPYFLTLDSASQGEYRGKMDSTRFNTDGVNNDGSDPDPNGDGHTDDGEEDIDGDGFNNSMEYKYHTDPTDAASNPNTADIPIHGTRGTPTEDESETDVEPMEFEEESSSNQRTPKAINSISAIEQTSINPAFYNQKLNKLLMKPI